MLLYEVLVRLVTSTTPRVMSEDGFVYTIEWFG